MKTDSKMIIINHNSRNITVEVSEKYVLSNMDSFEVVENQNGEWDLQNKKNKRSKRSICRCSICKKYILLKKYTTQSHIIQCVAQRDNLTEEFYKSSFGSLKIEYHEIKRMSVEEMLRRDDYKGVAGVWALWKDDKCITVAKTQNIYKEIYNDFNKMGVGSIDYAPYRDDGIIAIVSKDNSFEIEAKYAFDNRALKWGINRRKDRNGNDSEWNQIKNLLKTQYFDN